MLKNTFCHAPGISPRKEWLLWASGIHSWDCFLRADQLPLSRKMGASLSSHIKESYENLKKKNPVYFAESLKSNQHWRMFPDFRHSIGYLDIETTGLGYGD